MSLVAIVGCGSDSDDASADATPVPRVSPQLRAFVESEPPGVLLSGATAAAGVLLSEYWFTGGQLAQTTMPDEVMWPQAVTSVAGEGSVQLGFGAEVPPTRVKIRQFTKSPDAGSSVGTAADCTPDPAAESLCRARGDSGVEFDVTLTPGAAYMIVVAEWVDGDATGPEGAPRKPTVSASWGFSTGNQG